jgi:hypothetical protein
MRIDGERTLDRMKRIALCREILTLIVVFTLLVTPGAVALHHHADGEDHPDCALCQLQANLHSCEFSATVSLATCETPSGYVARAVESEPLTVALEILHARSPPAC